MIPHGTTLIDAAVAEVVGLNGHINSGNVFCVGIATHDEWLTGCIRGTACDLPMEWNPTGDMRYAMEAAIKARIFCDNSLTFSYGTWDFKYEALGFCDEPGTIEFLFGDGEKTPELAICRAVIGEEKWRELVRRK